MKTLKMTLMAMFAILFLAACNQEEGDKKLTINVMLDGLAETSELYLQQGTENGYVVIDTAELTENQYVFETTIEQPKLLYITSAAFRGAIPVFAEYGDIQVKANVDSLANAVIKGSASHDFFASTNKKLSDFDKVWQDFYYAHSKP